MKKDLLSNQQSPLTPSEKHKYHAEYRIDKNNKGWVSQSETARLCGIAKQTLSEQTTRLLSRPNDTNPIRTGIFKGFTPKVIASYINKDGKLSDTLFKIVLGYYASNGRKEAVALSRWLCIDGNSLSNISEYKTIKRAKKVCDCKGFVYIIRCNDYYKIGKAKNVISRMKGIQTGNPYELELVHTIICKNYNAFELSLHREFKDKRVRGEWFKLSRSDIKYLKSL